MGRVICIVYAIVGVPMTLLLLSIIVRKLLILLNNTYLWFRRKFSSDRRSESKIRFIHLLLTLLFSIIFLFIIPSIIFQHIEENWSFIDAFYFCFISLTTIGLGDLVAGDSPIQRNRLFYKICLTSNKQSFLFLLN
jgi:potassium channel subfamily K protein 1